MTFNNKADSRDEMQMLTFSLDNCVYGVNVSQVREVKNFEEVASDILVKLCPFFPLTRGIKLNDPIFQGNVGLIFRFESVITRQEPVNGTRLNTACFPLSP